MRVSGEQSNIPSAVFIPSPPLSSPSASLEAFGPSPSPSPSPSQEPTLPGLPLFDAPVFSSENRTLLTTSQTPFFKFATMSVDQGPPAEQNVGPTWGAHLAVLSFSGARPQQRHEARFNHHESPAFPHSPLDSSSPVTSPLDGGAIPDIYCFHGRHLASGDNFIDPSTFYSQPGWFPGPSSPTSQSLLPTAITPPHHDPNRYRPELGADYVVRPMLTSQQGRFAEYDAPVRSVPRTPAALYDVRYDTMDNREGLNKYGKYLTSPECPVSQIIAWHSLERSRQISRFAIPLLPCGPLHPV